jgi:hypothetical protein
MTGLKTGSQAEFPRLPAIPIWSCSEWGLPCRFCCQTRGALLPHRFTLTRLRSEAAKAGGLFSVALSLGSPPAAVSRHSVSMEPGLSSTSAFLVGHNAREPAAAAQPTDTLYKGRAGSGVKRAEGK